VIPPVGGLDLTVLVALILIQIAQYLLRQMFVV
jgi:YggT family protein